MTIPYVGFEVQICGLNLRSFAEMEALRKQIRAVLLEMHTGARIDADVVVSITEYAGVAIDEDANDGHIERVPDPSARSI